MVATQLIEDPESKKEFEAFCSSIVARYLKKIAPEGVKVLTMPAVETN